MASLRFAAIIPLATVPAVRMAESGTFD